MFKAKFKVLQNTTVVYDTYTQGSYIRNKTVIIPAGAIIQGEKLTKGNKDIISTNAKQFGVDELIEIPAEQVKKLFPWKMVLGIVIPIILIVVIIIVAIRDK